jgi:hypothetical protein
MTTCFALMLAAIGTHARAAEALRPARNAFRVEIGNAEGCPVRILERRTRAASTLQEDFGARPYSLREYGAGEFQIAFDVSFRSEGEQDVAAVAFLWEGFGDDGKPLYRRIGTHDDAKPLAPGRLATLHEVDLDPSRGRAWYRVSVYRVVMADGSVWRAPTEETRPAP